MEKELLFINVIFNLAKCNVYITFVKLFVLSLEHLALKKQMDNFQMVKHHLFAKISLHYSDKLNLLTMIRLSEQKKGIE